MPSDPWGKEITTPRPLPSRLLGERGPGADVDAVLWVWLFVFWASGRASWKQSLAETASLGDFSVLLRKSEKLYFVYSPATFILCFLLFQPNWRVNSLSSPSDIHRMEERKINKKENKRERKNRTPREEVSVESLIMGLCWWIQTAWSFLSWAAPDLKGGLVQRSACLGLGSIQSHIRPQLILSRQTYFKCIWNSS